MKDKVGTEMNEEELGKVTGGISSALVGSDNLGSSNTCRTLSFSRVLELNKTQCQAKGCRWINNKCTR